MQFISAEEFLKEIQKGRDFYSPSKELYVFVYSESGSICVYSGITVEKALELDSYDEYWGAHLGMFGSQIFDEPKNLQWCKDCLFISDWKDITK